MDQREDWHLTDDIPHELGRGDPFAAAIRASRMPMIITDPRQPDNPIVFANQAFQQLTGYSRDEIIGTNCRFLQGPDTDRSQVSKVRDAIASNTSVNVDLLNYRKDGSTFWNALYVSPVRNKNGEVEFFFASQFDVTERIEAQRVIAEQKAIVEREVRARTAELEHALDAKTLLLNEVDHRVKNNLNMIGSLLRLQARRLPDPELRRTLDAMLERVDALAGVHRRLYQSGDVMRFDIGAFAQGLASDVVGASGRDNIRVVTDVEPVMIPSSDAAALGLVLNEVMTNAIKHAFADGRGGTLGLAIRKDGDRATIHVTDDGPGMNGGASGDTLGKTLVERLSRQVGAETRWDGADPGTRVTIEFSTDSEGAGA